MLVIFDLRITAARQTAAARTATRTATRAARSQC